MINKFKEAWIRKNDSWTTHWAVSGSRDEWWIVYWDLDDQGEFIRRAGAKTFIGDKTWRTYEGAKRWGIEHFGGFPEKNIP